METLGSGSACRLIEIPGDPVPFARPRPHYKKPGAMIHPRRYRNWLKDARDIIPPRLVEGPLAVELVALFPRPRSWPKRIQRTLVWRPSIPDIDNLLKAGLDACTGLAYADDAVIVRAVGTKFYSKNRNCGLMIHVAQVKQISVPWGLSYTPCECWSKVRFMEEGEEEPSPSIFNQ